MPQEIISVKQSLNQIDVAERQFRAALDSYIAAVQAIDRHVLPLQPTLEPVYRRRLKEIHAAIHAGSMEETRGQVDDLLAGYCQQTVELLNERSEDIRQILLTLAGATSLMDQQSDGYGEQFRQIAARMENVKQLVDLSEIRREITGQVDALNSVAARMHLESESTIVKLKGEMSAVRERLDEAERLAETDPLTGLLNRRGMERHVGELIKKGQPFCVMLMDLNRFKGINDRHGHLCGDEVLTAFAARLTSELRAGDSMSRWGGDEFLTALGLPYREAVQRSHQIANKVCGRYTLSAGLSLQISASVGLSQYREGQTSKEVFAAADALLYGNKEARR